MLAIFAYTTDYESWTEKSNMMTSSLHDQWFGVGLHAFTNRIINLNFFENGLVGPIPTELGKLTAVTDLNLS